MQRCEPFVGGNGASCAAAVREDAESVASGGGAGPGRDERPPVLEAQPSEAVEVGPGARRPYHQACQLEKTCCGPTHTGRAHTGLRTSPEHLSHPAHSRQEQRHRRQARARVVGVSSVPLSLHAAAL
jgi:hypothetical protein